MKHYLFITKHGKLFSNGGTVTFIDEKGNKKALPVNNIDSIFCLGSVSLTSGIIKLILKRGLKIHFLTKEGSYQGTLSNQSLLEGQVVINQVKIFTDNRLSKHYALEKLRAMKQAFTVLFKRYNDLERSRALGDIKIRGLNNYELLGVEATMWRIAYDFLKETLKTFKFESRQYYPPVGEVNALISFINALLYSEAITLTREVGLLPEISFLHSSKEKRPSLVLDIADIFKPAVTLTLILKLDKSKEITSYDFETKSIGTYLNESGKVTVVKEFRDLMRKTIPSEKLKREISIRKLLKLEIENIKSSLISQKEYKSFKRWDLVYNSCL